MARSEADPVPCFPAKGHDHQGCIDRALDRAADISAARGARLTLLRRRVLKLIWGGHRPIGAYEILAALKREHRAAVPPTVYRALDFLLEHGLVHRIEHLNAYVGCAFPEVLHGGQFLVCRSCGLAAEINDGRIDAAIRHGAGAAGFMVGRPTIEVEGLCPHCQPDCQEGSAGHG